MMLNLEFDWDPAKAQANLRKHGVPFHKACQVFKDAERLEQLDFSGDHDEECWDVQGNLCTSLQPAFYLNKL